MKKVNIKLTIALVGLFVSFIFLIFANKTKVCLSLGLILLGASIAMFGYYKTSIINSGLKDIKEDLQDIDEGDAEAKKELKKYSKNFNRQRIGTSITFYLCAILLVVLGFYCLI